MREQNVAIKQNTITLNVILSHPQRIAVIVVFVVGICDISNVQIRKISGNEVLYHIFPVSRDHNELIYAVLQHIVDGHFQDRLIPHL